MTIKIWGKYQNGKPEVIDTAQNWKEARSLLQEYRVAYGADWIIWGGLKKDMPS